VVNTGFYVPVMVGFLNQLEKGLPFQGTARSEMHYVRPTMAVTGATIISLRKLKLLRQRER
jgi:hypothetical protein